jgi:hypothetical protein
LGLKIYSQHLITNTKNYFMSGRGDNNKHGSAGRGASNQSNQAFIADGKKQPKSNHDKKKSGSKPSQQQDKSADQSANRNRSTNS